MADAARTVDVVRVRGAACVRGVDRAATEEPLQVRLHGRPFAVIMRTPGLDCELVAGFLLAEGVLRGPDDIGVIAHCTDPEVPHAENVVDVRFAGESGARVERLLAEQRRVAMNSSCGLCGRLTIESLRVDRQPLAPSWVVRREVLASLPDRLRAAQTTFGETGGLHAAGLFSAEGRLEDVAEDVGRHNAVDKVVGRQLIREALPLSNAILCVSGRTSFEIIQKAFLAGVPVVAAVSAPSTLAIELADEAGITLAGFVRGGGFNLYTHDRRVDLA